MKRVDDFCTLNGMRSLSGPIGPTPFYPNHDLEPLDEHL